MASANQLAGSPVDPNLLVLESTVGILVSHDLGANFGWICEAPVGYGDGGPQDPSIAMTTAHVLAGLRQGMSLSPDDGCTWSFALNDPVVDVVVRRDDPHTALAVTSAYAGVGDAGENLYMTHVLVSHDDGNTWSQLGVAIDPTVTVETIDVALSDSNRLYIGGAARRPTDDGGIERVGVVLTSVNSGATYARTDIPLNSGNESKYASAFVSAVDPADPDLLYVRVSDTLADRLIVSTDGAKTFTTAYQATGPLLGFALSADGSKLFLGGPFDGVLLARTGLDAGTSPSFTKQSTTSVSCLAWLGGSLYACVRQPGSTFLQYVGASANDGVTFQPKFYLGCLSPLSCPGPDIAVQCDPGLPLLHATVGPCPEGGATTSDSGLDSGELDGAAIGADGAPLPRGEAGESDGGRQTGEPALGGCGCGAGESASALGGFSAFVSTLALALRRRRQRGRA